MSITWHDLRRLAEKAQGRQHKDQKLRVDNGRLVLEDLDANALPGIQIDRQHDPKAKQIKVKVPDVKFENVTPGPDNDVGEVGDSLFWSMAAIEKFLIPYYAGYWEVAQVASRIRDRFADPEVLAILHLPDSEPDLGRAAMMGMTVNDVLSRTLTEIVVKNGQATAQAFRAK